MFSSRFWATTVTSSISTAVAFALSTFALAACPQLTAGSASSNATAEAVAHRSARCRFIATSPFTELRAGHESPQRGETNLKSQPPESGDRTMKMIAGEDYRTKLRKLT